MSVDALDQTKHTEDPTYDSRTGNGFGGLHVVDESPGSAPEQGAPPVHENAVGEPRTGGAGGDGREQSASSTVSNDAITGTLESRGTDHGAEVASSSVEPVADREARAHRRRRVNPDSGIFIRVIVVGVVLLGLVAFAISFVALMDIAHWLGLPRWMHWSIPVFIDLAILIYAGAVLIHKARGESTVISWLVLLTFTAVSVVANSAHAIAYGSGTEWESWIGAGIAAMVPMAIFIATEQLARIAVENPQTRRREVQDATRWEATLAEQERERLEMEAQYAEQKAELTARRAAAERQAQLEQEEHETQLAIARAEREKRVKEATKTQEPESQPGYQGAQGNGVPTTPRRIQGSVQPTPTQDSAQSSTGEPARQVSRPRTSSAVATSEAWVRDQVEAGHTPTGMELAEALGLSERTARRHLQKIKETHPEWFSEEGQADE
ncbi:DUF2637 domain-containing protein [Nesterenkonia sp. K-15-9-6]|uniref:DUF2637 domain-containing protein n=1 Tax=Nesterenkonia sp. K-15-9-6 TaxID=3093918 RepID=UPI0040446637